MFSKLTAPLLLLTLAILLYGCAQNPRGPANIFNQDDREYLAKDGTLPIGSIHRDPKKPFEHGTGFQIDSCHVLTNYHVIKSNGKEHEEDFRVFYSDSTNKYIKAKLVLSGRPDLLHDQSVASTNPRDWALLKLDECQAKDSYFTLASLSKDDLPRGNLQMIGFPDDIGESSIALDPSCEIRQMRGQTLLHICASRPGSSGSPIFFEDDGQWQVVAINVSQRSDFREIIVGYSDWIANSAIAPINYLQAVGQYLKEQELTAPLP